MIPEEMDAVCIAEVDYLDFTHQRDGHAIFIDREEPEIPKQVNGILLLGTVYAQKVLKPLAEVNPHFARLMKRSMRFLERNEKITDKIANTILHGRTRLILLMNSIGGIDHSLAVFETLAHIMQYGGGEVVTFVGRDALSAGAEALVECDRNYTLAESIIGFHASAPQEKITEEERRRRISQDTEDIRKKLRKRLVGASLEAALRRIDNAEADEKNTDNQVEFSPEELPGLITRVYPNGVQLAEQFERESGQRVHFGRMPFEDRYATFFYREWKLSQLRAARPDILAAIERGEGEEAARIIEERVISKGDLQRHNWLLPEIRKTLNITIK